MLALRQYKDGNAFTLIELLVVIAIISLLSSIVMANISDVRANARDTRRVEDMRQIRTALEVYRNRHGYLPGWGGSCDFSSDGDFTAIAQRLHDPDEHSCMVDELASVMDGAIPTDPLADDEFYYVYDNWHTNTSGRCDGEPAVAIGFNTSETGIDDRETTTGTDQNMHNAAYNRIICLD